MFNKLVEANVDHYINHPKQHAALIAVALVGYMVVVHKAAKYVAKEKPELRSGMYA